MIYESKQDLQNEDGVANALAEKWKCEQKKLGELSHIDRGLYREGRLSAYVEIKCRNNAHDKYPDYMIDAHKLGAGLWVSHYDGLPFFLVIRFTDGIYYHRVTDESLRTQGVGGRTDRGDPLDVEMCTYIPMERFQKL